MITNSTTQNVHQKITDLVITAIEAGAAKFEMPWHRENPRPMNVASRNRYRGVNTLALWIAQESHGYATGTWGTYKQWKNLGAQVRKGEQASTVVFYKEGEKLDDDENKSDRYFVATASWVFNADQVSGYSVSTTPFIDKTLALDHADEFVAATYAKIGSNGNYACYPECFTNSPICTQIKHWVEIMLLICRPIGLGTPVFVKSHGAIKRADTQNRPN
jgi:antirestriction protein ArdC